VERLGEDVVPSVADDVTARREVLEEPRGRGGTKLQAPSSGGLSLIVIMITMAVDDALATVALERREKP
jgi:hypothetical protein